MPSVIRRPWASVTTSSTVWMPAPITKAPSTCVFKNPKKPYKKLPPLQPPSPSAWPSAAGAPGMTV